MVVYKSADDKINLNVSYGLGTEYIQVTFTTTDGGTITVSNAEVFACYQPTRKFILYY